MIGWFVSTEAKPEDKPASASLSRQGAGGN